MAKVTIASKSFAFNDDGSHMRDALFSSYPNGGEEVSTLKLGESARIPTSTVASPLRSPYQLSLGRKYTKDGELGIFTAEKYFSGSMDKTEKTTSENGWKQPPNIDGKIIDPQQPKKAFKSGTPRACSEASWNSQSALLQKYPSPNMQKQMSGNNFFGCFGCNCAGKKSGEVAEKVGKNRNLSPSKKFLHLEEQHNPEMFINGRVDVGQMRTIMAGNKQNHQEFKHGEEMDCRIAYKGGVGSKREDPFTFPSLNPAVRNHPTVGKALEEEARISLEVFGSKSSYMVKDDMASNLRRKLIMLTSAGRHPIKDVPASSNSMDHGDLESDASSDLFEIESFCSKAHHPFFHPQASDDMSSCYEPSEASIEWSVVTASAANFSIASEYDNQKPTEKIITTTTGTTTEATMAKAAQRRPHTSLLGCRSANAVKVVANAKRMLEKDEHVLHRRLQSDSMAPSTRFQAQSRVMGFQSADLQHAFAMHTAHAPHSLYMH